MVKNDFPMVARAFELFPGLSFNEFSTEMEKRCVALDDEPFVYKLLMLGYEVGRSAGYDYGYVEGVSATKRAVQGALDAQ